MATSDIKPYLTVTDVARLLMVSAPTIRLWTEKGFLKTELTFGGHRRYIRADIERLMRERGLKDLDASSEPGANQPKKLSVLIIDDEQELADTLAEGLRNALPDATVTVATDGFIGGLLAVQQQPDFVLLDLMMPGINGVEVCKVLKNTPSTKGIRIIVTTGASNAEQAQAAIDAGAETCLFKPFRLSHLREVIAQPLVAESI